MLSCCWHAVWMKVVLPDPVRPMTAIKTCGLRLSPEDAMFAWMLSKSGRVVASES